MQSVQFERQNRLVVCAKGKTCKKVLTKGLTAFIIKAYRKGGRYRTKIRSSQKDLKKIEKKCLTKNPNGAILIAYQTTGRKEIRPTTKGDLYESRILPVLHENR